MMSKPKVYTMEFGFVYPHLINKVEKRAEQKVKQINLLNG